jgi:hypothetical protein
VKRNRDKGGYQLPARVSITRETHEAFLESAKTNGNEEKYWSWLRNHAEIIDDQRF